MLTVTVDKVVVIKGKVSLGLVVRYGEHGPVRFVQAHLPIGLMPPSTLTALLSEWDRIHEHEPEDLDAPLF